MVDGLLRTSTVSLHDPQNCLISIQFLMFIQMVRELILPVDIYLGVKLDIERLRGQCQAVKRL